MNQLGENCIGRTNRTSMVYKKFKRAARCSTEPTEIIMPTPMFGLFGWFDVWLHDVLFGSVDGFWIDNQSGVRVTCRRIDGSTTAVFACCCSGNRTWMEFKHPATLLKISYLDQSGTEHMLAHTNVQNRDVLVIKPTHISFTYDQNEPMLRSEDSDPWEMLDADE